MEDTLGNRISAARKKLGMTQDKLAEQLGVTAQAVSKWENDQSCPDVTMLPKLAEIFGTTTDALLGMAPEPAEPIRHYQVEADEESEGIHITGDNVDIQLGSARKGSVFFAVWVLLFGGLLLAVSVLDKDIGWWSLCWPSFVLVMGVYTLTKHFNFMGLGFTLFGGYFLLGNFLFIPFNKSVIWPILIVLLGLSLLADALRRPKKSHFVIHNGSGPKVERTSFTYQEESFDCSTSFGEANRVIVLERLSRGKANVSFGELTVDLTQVMEFAPDCQLELNCSFGELELRVPKRCRVEYRDSSSFAHTEVCGHAYDDAADRIYLDCSASFGEIEIRYI